MSELQLYESLEKMIKAAEAGDRETVIKINHEFSKLLSSEYGHLPNWSMNKEALKYDAVRNVATRSVTIWPERDKSLALMQEGFSKIQKPKH